jgi:hypothetical protein
MRKLELGRPSADLKSYVLAYAEREVDPAELATTQAVPPRLEQVFEFQFGDMYNVIGPDGKLTHTRESLVIGGFHDKVPGGGQARRESVRIIFPADGLLTPIPCPGVSPYESASRSRGGARIAHSLTSKPVGGASVVCPPRTNCRGRSSFPSRSGILAQRGSGWSRNGSSHCAVLCE